MKRVLIFGLVALILITTAEARRKKKKTGKITDGVYTDADYNLSLNIVESWKGKTQSSKKNPHIRLVCVQKDFGIPAHFLMVPDQAQMPKFVIFADTSTMGVRPFVDSLLSRSFKSKQKKEILSEFEILSKKDLTPSGMATLRIGEERGVIWKGKSDYTRDIQSSASSSGGRRVKGTYGGAIFAFKKDGLIVVGGLICEYDFYDAVMKEAIAIMSSLTFGPDAEPES
jgi:hypothetical protein